MMKLKELTHATLLSRIEEAIEVGNAAEDSFPLWARKAVVQEVTLRIEQDLETLGASAFDDEDAQQISDKLRKLEVSIKVDVLCSVTDLCSEMLKTAEEVLDQPKEGDVVTEEK